MNSLRRLPAVIASIACGAAVVWPAYASAADIVAKPFEAYLAIGTTYDDNIFRMQDSAEGLQVLGTESLDDSYMTVTAGFENVIVMEAQAFEFQGDVFRQIYNDFGEFDYTGGKFRGAWNWKTSDATRGDAGVRYRRNMRDFSNMNVPMRDIVDQYTAFISVDKRLAERWLLRIAPEVTKLEFSASPQLNKRRFDLEAELQYAASQNSSFGLLTTMTQSSFDEARDQDFSGWSLGPSVRWQYTPDLKFTASVGYTHQGLEEAQSDAQDFDGITGFAVAEFQSRESLSWKLRVFRDISDLGGEIPRYTKRNGVSLIPMWKITAKLTGRAELTYERRDFIAFSGPVIDRQDDFFVQKVWLDLSVGQRWLVSAGVGGENRTSNVAIQEFDDFTAYATVRFNF